MQSKKSKPGRLYPRIAKILGISFIFFACSVFSPDNTDVVETAVTPVQVGGDQLESGGQTENGEALPDEAFSVNQQFYHSGFRVELGEGRFYGAKEEFSSDVGYFVTIDAVFENLGPYETLFYNTVALVSGDNSYSSLFNSDLPSVPSGLSSSGQYVFEVDPDFTLAGSRLLIGSSGENLAQIPLGPDSGELITLEPVQLPVSGQISISLLDLNFTAAELRADLPESFSEIEEGKLSLTIFFDGVSRNSGSWGVYPQDFALILPGGSAVGPAGSKLDPMQGAEGGITTSDQFIRFLVDSPPAGAYTLRFTPGSWFVGEDGVTEATFDFTID